MITFADDGRTLNPIAPHERAWALFLIFGLAELGLDSEDVKSWDQHIDWVASRFNSPDAWLGPAGDRFRETWGMHNPSLEFVQWWRRFKAAHAADTPADIDKLISTFLFDA
jgi:hypothetical protein